MTEAEAAYQLQPELSLLNILHWAKVSVTCHLVIVRVLGDAIWVRSKFSSRQTVLSDALKVLTII